MISATYVKFMNREDLVKMLTEIHTFSIITKDGRKLYMDKRVEKATYEDFNDIRICWHATAFKLSAFDYEDVLISGEGYVRYNSFIYRSNIDSPQGVILIKKYGFIRED